MANLPVKNASGSDVEIKATGSGTSIDPFVTENLSANRISTYTHSSVSVTSTSGTVIASNANRRHLLIINTSTVVAYLRLASSGATTNDIPLAAAVATGTAGGSYEIADWNLYTGAIVGITASGTATLSVVEGV